MPGKKGFMTKEKRMHQLNKELVDMRNRGLVDMAKDPMVRRKQKELKIVGGLTLAEEEELESFSFMKEYMEFIKNRGLNLG